MLAATRPDLTIVPLRGNVDTRLRKLDAGELDAIILAAAGLVRLGHGHRIVERLDTTRFLPAIGQGMLAIETRAGDSEMIDLVRRALHDPDTAACAALERAFLARLGGSCTTPLACHATLRGDQLVAEGLVGAPDGSRIVRDVISGASAEGAELGRALAEKLLAQGAGGILESLR